MQAAHICTGISGFDQGSRRRIPLVKIEGQPWHDGAWKGAISSPDWYHK